METKIFCHLHPLLCCSAMHCHALQCYASASTIAQYSPLPTIPPTSMSMPLTSNCWCLIGLRVSKTQPGLEVRSAPPRPLRDRAHRQHGFVVPKSGVHDLTTIPAPAFQAGGLSSVAILTPRHADIQHASHDQRKACNHALLGYLNMPGGRHSDTDDC
jgi:hypothetical protein